MAKVAKSVVMYGEVLMQSDWCRNRSVSSCNQFRTSLMKAVFAIMDEINDAGLLQ